MKLRIEGETLIRDIQKKFNDSYPYLKIEFFESTNPVNKSRRTRKINPNESVWKSATLDGFHSIDITKDRTVGEVEENFAKMFGLTAQVFRKSGNLWIETSLTDNWTLGKQNTEGASLNHIDKQYPDRKAENERFDAD